MHAVTAFVLAGGKSTRMGTDKAFLELGGKTLLANALAIAANVTSDVRIVGDAAKFSAYRMVVTDVYLDRGPLGGIHAALTGSPTDLNLMIGVDLPLLEVRFLRYLVSAAEAGNAVVAVPRVGAHYEPLCAVYRREFAAIAERALLARNNKIDALYSGVPLRVVNSEELAREGFSLRMFRNVNTLEDWKVAQKEFSRRDDVS